MIERLAMIDPLALLWSVVFAIGLAYAIRNYLSARSDLHAIGVPAPQIFAAVWYVEFWTIFTVFFVLMFLAGLFTIAQQESEYRSLALICLILGGVAATTLAYFYDRQSTRLRVMLTPEPGTPRRRSTDA